MTAGTVLDRIAVATRKRVAAAKALFPGSALRERIPKARVPAGFESAFRGGGLRIIAEIKRASPSEGTLAADLDPVEIAQQYMANGAAAISVLTEPEFFGGDLEHLAGVRRKVILPLLMKDFVVDEYQLLQARLHGADCVLLIVALLGDDGLRRMLAAAGELGLSALVEVHDEGELETALSRGARLVGVNNRDLKTLRVDLGVSRRLAERASGRGATLICESGISARSDMDELARLGYKGFLIGTHLIRSGSPGAALAGLLKGSPS